MDATQSGGRVALDLRKRPNGETAAFGKLMVALAMMKSRDHLVPFGVEVYEDATVDVPMDILTAVVSRLMRTPDAWRPDPGTLVGLCEAHRLERRSALRFKKREDCEREDCSVDGWSDRVVGGVHRMVRCECWTAHQEMVKAVGGPAERLALPAPAASEFTRVGDD